MLVTVTFWRPCHAIVSAIMTVLSLTGSPNSTCMTDVVYVTGHASCQWSAWPCPRREVTGQSTVAVTRSRLLQRVQRLEGQCNAGRCRGQINVLTGEVLKKERARIYRGRLTSVCVLCCRPRGMLEAASSEASGSASFGRVPSHC